jgi:hypothetical protein
MQCRDRPHRDVRRTVSDRRDRFAKGFELRHAGRGEPMPMPRTERDTEDALARSIRQHEAERSTDHVPWWKRLFAGRLFRGR